MQRTRHCVGAILAVSILLGAAPALAADDADATTSTQVSRRERAADVGKKSFDVVVLRPLQSLAVVVGGGLVVPAAVMSSPGGLPLIEEAWDYFVVIRYEDAWTRPLGEF